VGRPSERFCGSAASADQVGEGCADIHDVRVWVWRGYLLAAGLVAVAYFGAPRTGLAHLLLYDGVGLSAVAATGVGIWWHRPGDRRAWGYILAGQASFLTGDVCFYLLELRDQTAPFPSIADALYLAMYPLVILGLRRLVAQARPGRDLASLVDAAVVAVAAAALFGILVVDRYLSDSTLSLPARVISVAYPVMDIALLAIAARMVTGLRLDRSAVLLLTGLCGLLIADLDYGILNSAGTFTTGGVADVFWLAFYTLVAAAALHLLTAAVDEAVAAVVGRSSGPFSGACRHEFLCMTALPSSSWRQAPHGGVCRHGEAVSSLSRRRG
jgi:hypothetical protein